jgi:predicted XRE-type DNA-binding protein
MEITKSCGNVFLDLGFKPAIAENLRMRADLMIELRDYLKQLKLSPPQAAKRLGVRETTVKKLLQGKIGVFPVDKLIKMIVNAGLKVEVKVVK